MSKEKKVKLLVSASTRARSKALVDAIRFLDQDVTGVHGAKVPRAPEQYRLLACEVSAGSTPPTELLSSLKIGTHVLLAVPDLTVEFIAQLMQNPVVSHLLVSPFDDADLRHILDKLATGHIFGMDRYLAAGSKVHYRQITTYKERCNQVEEIEAFVRKQRLPSHIRRTASQVTDELIMNAMYHAPIDDTGERIFENVAPRDRIAAKASKHVSVRFAIQDRSLFLSVRDHFGSFRRDDMARRLLQCTTENIQIEDKNLGAGLGLYLVASSVTRLVVNILPRQLSEFICIMDPLENGEKRPLRCLSITTQRPLPSR